MSKYFLMRVASLGYYYINCKTLQLIDICICKRSFVFFDAVNKQKRKKELLLSLLLINWLLLLLLLILLLLLLIIIIIIIY